MRVGESQKSTAESCRKRLGQSTVWPAVVPAVATLAISLTLINGADSRTEVPRAGAPVEAEPSSTNNGPLFETPAPAPAQNSPAEPASAPESRAEEAGDTVQTLSGRVFEDRNQNGVFDAGDTGISGAAVSNGADVVSTDEQGIYRLPVKQDCIIFLIKPTGFRPETDENGIARSYYIHKPDGSPAGLKFPGVDPTGPLPDSVDFPLTRQSEDGGFDVLFFGDPQPRNQQEIDYIAHDVVEDLTGTDAVFGVTLGDILFDDLSLFESMNRTVGQLGIPWYNVLGNHDINYATDTDEFSDETFERVYGPPYYSFNYGGVHFLALDDVHWMKEGDRRFYRSGLNSRQLEFVENDLRLVPQEQLVVVMMHIPLAKSTPWIEPHREQLLRLMEERDHCISLAGHTHHHEHVLMGAESGWKGSEPHHHMICVTVSGSWWGGPSDEYGIPHTMCADGTPNGHCLLHIDGTEYSMHYRAARRPESFQVRVTAPEVTRQGSQPTVFANAFNARPDAVVEWKIVGRTEWRSMERTASADPEFLRLRAAQEALGEPPWRPLPKPMTCPHLWSTKIPNEVGPGTYTVQVRATNPDGVTMQGQRIIRVTAAE